ncbi:flagellar hook-associated protein FlgK [Asticcacaulis machinosus]|uniref:Flagellar hook-associated protein 1 n=1 Tax=Asticcacaulis machinosus TaxID=2984211 RepID=A0ABT5HJ33_9CAUL|nr:flagellar hook-associated protein FlgK [Asticcacaulis machinosus]MDC7676250.1 flagellar hook-associated protein FlgK [Asticcacaulis machinosus]
MSLSTILNIGVSGLMTAQNQLSIVSDNISNLNTPGYIRKKLEQNAVTVNGVGAGVTTGQVNLSTSTYLQSASLKATAASSQAQAYYDLLDQIQGQFGDISEAGNVFNMGDEVFTSIAKAAESPQSTASRQEIISNMENFLDETNRIASQIQTIRKDADSRVSSGVKTINDLLKNISDLNGPISQAYVTGGDASGAQTTQSQYLDQLSKLIDINVGSNGTGGVTLRTQSGYTLITKESYATLSYQPAGNVNADTSFNSIYVTSPDGQKRDFADHLQGGELKGLIDLRDDTSVKISEQLSEYVSAFADQLNAAHNASSAVPAPTTLEGKQTHLTQAEALTGFSGTTNLVVTNSSGVIQRRVEVNMTAGTWTAYNAAGAAVGTGGYTPATFDADMTTAMGGYGTVSFTTGQLTMTAATTAPGAAGNGISIVEPDTGASAKNGRSLSHYFGMNDLITASSQTQYDTGLTGTSNHGFTAGDTIRFDLKEADGSILAKVDFAIPAGGTMNDLLTALNSTTAGVGSYGQFTLSGEGELVFNGYGTPANKLGVLSDQTARLNASGASFTEFFGVGGTQASRISSFSVNDKISNNLYLLSMAKVDLSAPAGESALVSGDGSGALAMSQIGDANYNFNKAGYSGVGWSSLSRYASDLAGQIGTLTSAAEARRDSAEALASEAVARRSSVEGVNLDEELVNLTTFQQAYNASSRVIQTAKDMYDILLGLV